MKTSQLLSTFLCGMLLAACSSPSPLVNTDYRLDYGRLHTDVRFTSGSVTRSGPNFNETNAARIRTLGDKRFFVQWREDNQTFVTMLLDLNKMHVFSSILPHGEQAEPMFLAGSVEKKH